MKTSPAASPKLHFFSYKGAFLFFIYIFIVNIIINPLLNVIGLDKQWSLYFVNTIGISTGLTAVIVFIEGKCKSKKKAAVLFLSLLILSLIICYLIVFL